MLWKNSAKLHIHIRSSYPNVFLNRVSLKSVAELPGNYFVQFFTNYWTVKNRWGFLPRKFGLLSRPTQCRGSWNRLSPQRTIYEPVKHLWLNFFAKIVKSFFPLTIFAKKLYHRSFFAKKLYIIDGVLNVFLLLVCFWNRVVHKLDGIREFFFEYSKLFPPKRAKLFRSHHLGFFCYSAVLKNVVLFTKKHVCLGIFLNKVAACSAVVLSKRASRTCGFLWIFLNFLERLFYRKLFIQYIRKIFRKTNISYSLIRTNTWVFPEILRTY